MFDSRPAILSFKYQISTLSKIIIRLSTCPEWNQTSHYLENKIFQKLFYNALDSFYLHLISFIGSWSHQTNESVSILAIEIDTKYRYWAWKVLQIIDWRWERRADSSVLSRITNGISRNRKVDLKTRLELEKVWITKHTHILRGLLNW